MTPLRPLCARFIGRQFGVYCLTTGPSVCEMGGFWRDMRPDQLRMLSLGMWALCKVGIAPALKLRMFQSGNIDGFCPPFISTPSSYIPRTNVESLLYFTNGDCVTLWAVSSMAGVHGVEFSRWLNYLQTAWSVILSPARLLENLILQRQVTRPLTRIHTTIIVRQTGMINNNLFFCILKQTAIHNYGNK